MKIKDITEGILQPDSDYINELSGILDNINIEYQAYLDDNNDKDDADELVAIMDSIFAAYDLPIAVHSSKAGTKGVDMYVQAAQVHGDGSMDLILHRDSIDGGHWGPKTFKRIILKTFEHETIHLGQRDRMGKEKYSKLPSGYQKGLLKMKKSGKMNDLIRTYFRDPQELMAHGHDLAREIEGSSDPHSALRNPEKYRKELPTYDKHRQIFPPNAKPLQRMITYASKYLDSF